MRRRTTLVLVAVLLLLFSGPPEAKAEKRIALLIGNQKYTDAVGPLKNPLNDIKRIGDALSQVGFEVMKPVTDATGKDILYAVHAYADKLSDAGPDAVGFFYYSGHGVAAGRSSVNYLIPVDVKSPKSRVIEVEGVSLDKITQILNRKAAQASHFVIFDACRNKLRGSRGSKGFVPVSEHPGMLIAFSTSPGATASDGDEKDGSGPYALALASEITKPGNNHLFVFHNVKDAVARATGDEQVPWERNGLRKLVEFSKSARPSPGPAATSTKEPRPSVSEEAAKVWAQFKNTKDQEALEDFIRHFKGTFYATRAESLLKKLREEKVAVGTFPKRDETKGDTPGETFKDCESCPEMVVIPAGSFMMGESDADIKAKKAFENDAPRHNVAIPKAFAVGKFEVTFAEWDACASGGGCDRYKPADEGWGRGKRPVINVSWEDTKKYVKWLSGKTGKTYRLLSEAEWEYAARAGTKTAYSTGNTITRDQANFGFKLTTEVGKYTPNAFGLHDMHGNVLEWVEDCWHSGYEGAPSDGSAWVKACTETRRVLRGGSWDFDARFLRAAGRGRGRPDYRGNYYGFRVARVLFPARTP